MWLVLAKLQGLYERDEERADHSTVDEFVGVLIVVTLGTWFFQALTWGTGLASPQLGRLVVFWLLAIALSRRCGRSPGASAGARRPTRCEQSSWARARSVSSSLARSASIPSMGSI